MKSKRIVRGNLDRFRFPESIRLSATNGTSSGWGNILTCKHTTCLVTKYRMIQLSLLTLYLRRYSWNHRFRQHHKASKAKLLSYVYKLRLFSFLFPFPVLLDRTYSQGNSRDRFKWNTTSETYHGEAPANLIINPLPTLPWVTCREAPAKIVTKIAS